MMQAFLIYLPMFDTTHTKFYPYSATDLEVIIINNLETVQFTINNQSHLTVMFRLSTFLWPQFIPHREHYLNYTDQWHEMSQRCVGLRIKCVLFFSDFNQNWNILINSVKIPSMKFQENPSDRNYTVPCGQSDMMRYHSKNPPHKRHNSSYNTGLLLHNMKAQHFAKM
jgi:hypothetical protein